jgi:hypothetical protein
MLHEDEQTRAALLLSRQPVDEAVERMLRRLVPTRG